MHRSDLFAIGLSGLTFVAGLYETATAVGLPDAIEAVSPGHGKAIVAYLALASLSAATIVRIINNPKDAPAKALTSNAVFVMPDTKTVTAETPSVPVTAPSLPPPTGA